MLTPTGVTTQDYISSIKADSPVHVRMVFNAQNITLEDQDVNITDGLVLSDILNGDIDLTFGRAVMKQLTVGILNTSRVSSLIWTDEFTLEFGVEINGSINWVKIGTFLGERPKNITNVEIIEFTAYDSMSRFDILVDDFWDGITFPITVESIYHDLCDYVGVPYTSGDELPNIMSRVFTTSPSQLRGYTCRDLLAWIAEACGCYAKINANGQCNMVWYTDHSSELAFALDDEFHIETADIDIGLTWDEFDDYYWNDADKFVWNDLCGYEEVYGIDYLQVKQYGVDLDVDYPMNIGGNAYMIVDNPLLLVESAQDILDYIKPIYDRLMAFGGHLPVSIDCVGNWLVESGDVISVDVDDTHTVNAPVYVRSLKWNGSCVDTFETTGNVVREQVSNENRQKLDARNRIMLYAKDLYYNRQSGIDIEPSGVTISGGKYIKIESGGTFDVDATNFKIDSVNKYLQTGYWKFDEYGAHCLEPDLPSEFQIGNLNDRVPHSVGLFYTINTTANKASRIVLYAGGYNSSANAYYESGLNFYSAYNSGNPYMLVTPRSGTTLRIGQNAGSSSKVEEIWAVDCHATKFYGTYDATGENIISSDGYISVYPRGTTGNKIQLEEYTYNGTTYTKIWGSGTMIFEGTVQSPSSRDIKHDIHPIDEMGDKIDRLRPVSFVYDNDGGENKHYGLIYEEAVDVMSQICSNNESSKGINYMELIPVLLKEIQSLRTRVKELEERGVN